MSSSYNISVIKNKLSLLCGSTVDFLKGVGNYLFFYYNNRYALYNTKTNLCVIDIQKLSYRKEYVFYCTSNNAVFFNASDDVILLDFPFTNSRDWYCSAVFSKIASDVFTNLWFYDIVSDENIFITFINSEKVYHDNTYFCSLINKNFLVFFDKSLMYSDKGVCDNVKVLFLYYNGFKKITTKSVNYVFKKRRGFCFIT